MTCAVNSSLLSKGRRTLMNQAKLEQDINPFIG
jgi:hypothetical protein